MKSIANTFKHQDGSSMISKTRWRRWWAESIPGKPPHKWKLAWLQTLFLSPFWKTPSSKPFWKNPLISFTCLSSPKAPQKYHLQKIPLSLSVAWRSPLCSYLKPPSQPKKKYLSKKNSKPRRPSLCPSPRKMNLFFLRKCLFPQTKQKLLPPKKISAASLKATTVPAAASHLPLSHTLLITEKCCPLWRSPQVPTIHWLLQKALYDSIVAN